MSLTISPAFRVSSDADLFEVAEGLRTVLIPHLSNEFRKEAVRMAISEFDNPGNLISGQDFPKFLETHVSHLRQNLAGDLTNYDKYDLQPFQRILDFQAIFLRNKVRGETYVLLSQDGLNKEGEILVLGVEGIASDFCYWNGSDSQVNGSNPLITDITEEEWLRRGDSWKETIDYKKGMVQQGLVVKLFESISIYELLSWKSYKGEVALIAEYALEERFRRIVFNTYLEKLRKVYPDLDIMETINGSWRFLNPKKDRAYGSLPFAEEESHRLQDAISFAEERVTAFPIVF